MIITLLVVIPSLTRGASNILKAVIPSTTQGKDSEADVHYGMLLCNSRVINCRAAAWPSLLVAVLY